MIDLHLHSNHSDGTDTLDELLEAVLKQNLTCVALTDHDTLSGVDRFAAMAEAASIVCIRGCELSVDFKPGLFHMLVYNIPRGDSPFTALLEETTLSRRNYAFDVVNLLQAKGMDITIDDILKYCKSGEPAKMHIAMALVEKKAARNTHDALESILGKNGYAHVSRKKITPYEAIDAAKKTGALTFMAHPHTTGLNDRELDAYIAGLADYGLSGIECYTTCSTKNGYIDIPVERTLMYKSIATKYNLLVSGGSDYHGKAKPGVSPGIGAGSLNISDELCEQFF